MSDRVLVVTNDFPPRRGGIESFVASLCDGLDPEHVVVYTSRTSGAEAHDAAVPYPVIRDRSRVLLPTPRVAARASRLVTSYGCDRIVFGASAPLGLMAARLRGANPSIRRIVALTHGHETWWARLPVARRVLRRIGDSVDVLTYVSDYCRGEVARAVSAEAAARMVRLSPGVDAARFSPGDPGTDARAATGVPPDAPLVVAASRLVARKGQDVLVRAMPRVLELVPDARLVIVGHGPAGRRLRREVARLGLDDAVHLVPSVAWDQMPDVYRSADVFALPCRTRLGGLEPEAFGIVFIEAAASGLPVVVGRSGGAPETVRDGHTGYVVDPRDASEVANRVAALLADRGEASRMGEAGRAWVNEAWSSVASTATLRRLLEL